jgi:hypothetical protein
MTHWPKQAPSVSKLTAGSGLVLDDCQLAVETAISDFIVCHVIKDIIWIQTKIASFYVPHHLIQVQKQHMCYVAILNLQQEQNKRDKFLRHTIALDSIWA